MKKSKPPHCIADKWSYLKNDKTSRYQLITAGLSSLLLNRSAAPLL